MLQGKKCIAAPCFSTKVCGIPQGCPWRSLKLLCAVAVWLHHSVHMQAGGMPPPPSPLVSDQHLVLLGGLDCGQQICPYLYPAGKATKRVHVQTASASIKAGKKIIFWLNISGKKTFGASGTEPQSGIFQSKLSYI